MGDHVDEEKVLFSSGSGKTMPFEMRAFVPKELAVICFIHFGLDGLSRVFLDIIKVNDIEEAICVRVGPELIHILDSASKTQEERENESSQIYRKHGCGPYLITSVHCVGVYRPTANGNLGLDGIAIVFWIGRKHEDLTGPTFKTLVTIIDSHSRVNDDVMISILNFHVDAIRPRIWEDLSGVVVCKRRFDATRLGIDDRDAAAVKGPKPTSGDVPKLLITIEGRRDRGDEEGKTCKNDRYISINDSHNEIRDERAIQV
jgi:hypothetical protein